jgi:hypothetical protein
MRVVPQPIAAMQHTIPLFPKNLFLFHYEKTHKTGMLIPFPFLGKRAE